MTRSDGAPQFGLLPAGTAFERKWIAYEERAAAEERDVVETLRGGRGEQAASASERRDGRIVMAKRDVYEVERIDNELKYITPTGAMKRAYLFEWTGYPRSASTWQDGGFGGSARLLQEDMEPLRTRLKTDGEAELDEIHHACLQQLQYELQRVLRRGEG